MSHPLLGRALGSIRVRAAVYIVLASVLVGVVVWALTGVIRDQARQQADATLHAQATVIAREIVREGRGQVQATAGNASRYLPDTRIVITVDGTDLVWNVPAGTVYARAEVRNRWATVTLERIDPIGTVDRRLLAGLISLGVGSVGLLAWFLSGSLTQRLRRSLRDLAGVAERLSEGDLSVRAPSTQGEAGVVADAFNRMASRLDANDARQREFLADAAHEMRTPVTAIEGFATALADGTARSEEDRKEAAETVRDEAVRLRHLIQDLQEITWLDLDPPVDRREADLADLARRMVTRYSAAAQDRGVSLTGPADGDHLTVWTDPEHVSTIMGNLTSNAIAATEPGGQVRLAVEAHGRDATIAVADTGVGIPAEKLPYIFDRLYRVDGSRRRSGLGGSGLGLAIVKRLALLLDGRVDVTSTPGVGTIFTVRLRGVRQHRPGRTQVVKA